MWGGTFMKKNHSNLPGEMLALMLINQYFYQLLGEVIQTQTFEAMKGQQDYYF